VAVTAAIPRSSRRAVFLDKDGTLIDDVPFNVDPERIRLTDGAAAALRMLADDGYRLIVVSNQPGVALGYFGAAALGDVQRRISQLLSPVGVVIDGWYWCTDGPDDGCTCRKPAAGLLLRAAREHGLDLGRSWFIGDILDDVEAGRAVGCGTVLVDDGGETEWNLWAERRPDHIVPNLRSAAERIVRSGVVSISSGSSAGTVP
jgi:D-glycero-D-manno-heptose 1,7-bisphosphate phosphatase